MRKPLVRAPNLCAIHKLALGKDVIGCLFTYEIVLDYWLQFYIEEILMVPFNIFGSHYPDNIF